jgi:azurin
MTSGVGRASPLVAALSLAVLVVLAGGACSGTLVAITPPPATPTPEPTPEPTAEPTPVATPEPGATPTATPAEAIKVALTIATAKGAKDFHYATDALSAPAGSTITLKLTNETNPDDEVGHNWVLVKPGQEASVLANGIKAGDDRDWLDTKDPGIIAATKLIEGNEKHSVTFAAPEPGTYTFLCTFPEHYAGGMKGTLTIQ